MIPLASANINLPAPYARKGVLSLHLLACLCLVLPGCLSRPALVKQSFAFAAPQEMPSIPAHGDLAVLRRVTVAAPFDTQSLTYRTGEFSYERDPYAEFLVPPGQALAAPIRDYLCATGLFSAVNEPGGIQKPGKILEVSVEELYGDFRKQAAPAAVLALRLTCLNSESGTPPRLLLEKAYSERVPLHSRTAAGVVVGLNEALKRAMSQAGTDLKHLRPD